jgi:hypothetical protein
LPKPPWRERKEAYVERLRSEPYSVRLVVAADKLHNARHLLSSYRVQGEDLWSHFNGGRDGTLWYYRSLVDAFARAGGRSRLVDELERTVTEIERLAGAERRA